MSKDYAIHEAATAGDVDKLRKLLKGSIFSRAVDVDRTGTAGLTALHYAASAGHLEAVKLLVESKASVAKTSENGVTPLQIACVRGRFAVAEFLLDHGADIDMRNAFGETAVIFAVANNHLSSVKLLLERRSDAMVRASNGTFRGKTALDIAEENKFDEIAALLRSHSASAPAAAAKSGEPVSAGSPAEIESKPPGLPAIVRAAEAGNVEALLQELDKGVHADFCDESGYTALHSLSRWNHHLNSVKLLVQRNASVHKASAEGWTALHHACYNGCVDVAALLLDQRAEIDKRNNNGETPLIRCVCVSQHPNVVKLLLARKADTTATATAGEFKGKIALDIAKDKKFDDVVKLLQSHSTPASQFTPAASSSSAATMPASGLASPTKIELKAGQSQSLPTQRLAAEKLRRAAQTGDLLTLQDELNKGVEVDSTTVFGDPALVIAANSGDFEIVKLLVQRKATVDKPESNGVTALYYACMNAYVEIAAFLLDSKADINNLNGYDHWTALMGAALTGKEACVRLLLERKADPTVKSRMDQTALDMAKEKKHDKIVALLSASVVSANQLDKTDFAAADGLQSVRLLPACI